AEHGGKHGFVVADMVDVDDFAPIEPVALPAGPVYVIVDLDPGDPMANWSPDEARPAVTAARRTPPTPREGIHRPVPQPAGLERSPCYRRRGTGRGGRAGPRAGGAPAVGTRSEPGRAGRETRKARKRGGCGPGNRHTWLGVASAAARIRPVDKAAVAAGL